MNGETCPSYHFLPGPYQQDEDVRDCPDRETHAAQRKAWDAEHADIVRHIPDDPFAGLDDLP